VVVDESAAGVEGRHQQRLEEAGAGVVLPVRARDVGFQRQRRGLVVGEVPFEHQALGDGPGLEVVAGELEGGQRVEREGGDEDQRAGPDGRRHVGEAAAHPADTFMGDFGVVGDLELPRYVEKPRGVEHATEPGPRGS
jgi:hypothetical protein